MDTALKQELIDCLADFVSDHKKQRIEQVLAGRTRHLTIVLEDVFQPHNASAVLRSCECFGVQDVHIIEDRNAYIVRGLRSGWTWCAIAGRRAMRRPVSRRSGLGVTGWWRRPRTGTNAR